MEPKNLQLTEASSHRPDVKRSSKFWLNMGNTLDIFGSASRFECARHTSRDFLQEAWVADGKSLASDWVVTGEVMRRAFLAYTYEQAKKRSRSKNSG